MIESDNLTISFDCENGNPDTAVLMIFRKVDIQGYKSGHSENKEVNIQGREGVELLKMFTKQQAINLYQLLVKN